MMVNNEVHGRLTPEAVNKVVSQIHETEKPTPTE
jgi:NADH:ubiquinone oxidoreductase subunit E